MSPWKDVDIPKPSSGIYAHDLRGIPAKATLDTQLSHNQLYFLNVRARDEMYYWGAGSSKGVLIDLSPPYPAPLYDPIRCTDEWRAFYQRPDVIQNLRHQGPAAGLLGCENMNDTMEAVGCARSYDLDWISDKLNGRCIGPTYLENHRILSDSGTVFFGDQPGLPLLYQSDRTFVSLNWYLKYIILIIYSHM